MSPRVLVTGASGFVGRSLIPMLGSRDCAVSTVASSDAANGAAALVDQITGSRPDVIIHLATRFVAEHDIEQIPYLIQANVEFGTLVAEGAVRAGASLVTIGSSWQHFEGRDYAPVSLYAATKQALDVILDYYVQVKGLDRRDIVLFDTYGPGDVRPKLIPTLMRAALMREPLEMSDGLQLIDLTYVDDVARGIVDVALDRESQQRSVVRSGSPLTIRGVVGVLETAIDRPVPVVWGARPSRPREMREDWVFGTGPSGWSPWVPLQEGLSRTWSEFRRRDAS